MLIVARGCIKQYSCRFTHFAAPAVPSRGVSRLIVLHAFQLLGPTVPYPDNSAIRSRRPAVSAFASESHLRSPGGISGPAGQPDGGTRALSRRSRVLMHNVSRGQPSPSICWRIPERQVAARRETPF